MRAVEALPARDVVLPFAERDEDRLAALAERMGGVVEIMACGILRGRLG